MLTKAANVPNFPGEYFAIPGFFHTFAKQTFNPTTKTHTVMVFGLILLGVIILGIIIKSAVNSDDDNNRKPAPVIRPISELSKEELKATLQKLETDIEMKKIEYQGAMSNQQVWPVTRNLMKQNLESMIERKQKVIAEIELRN